MSAAPNRVSIRLECSAPFLAAVSAEWIIQMVFDKLRLTGSMVPMGMWI